MQRRAAPERSPPSPPCSDRFPWTLFAPSSWLPFLCCFLLAPRLDRGERLFPESVKPVAHGLDPPWIHRVKSPRSLSTIDHQPRRLQHAEVLRDRWTAHVHTVGDFLHRALPAAHALEHR